VWLQCAAMPKAPTTITVINSVGQELQSFQLSKQSTHIRLDYPAGVYFLKINNSETCITQTITLTSK